MISENHPLKRRKPIDSPNKDTVCVSCKKNAAKNAIECDRCSKWEHKICTQVSDEMYGLINNLPENIKFFCTPCCKVITTVLEVNIKIDNLEGKFSKSLEDTQAKVLEQFKALELKLQKIQAIDQLKDQLKKLESMVQGSKVSDQLSNQIKEIVHKPIEQQLKSLEKASKQSNVITADTASKVVDEYRDMERRKWNLIVFNVPEPKSTESSQRKVEDREFFNSLIDHIGVVSVDLTDFRLGAKHLDKLCPLRVQFNNLGHRRSLLANAKKLHDLSSDIFKRIYINPDLSVKERQAQKKTEV